jgi:hypothetical protein
MFIKKLRILIISLLFFIKFVDATGTWMFNQRTHSEIEWKTIKTKHFDIHYYDEIEKIAIKGASIAEQIRPTLMEQMGLKTLDRLSIAFTAEDEILNGFATPANNTIIWVDQNDAALWVGDEKWLRTVLAHELQHLVFFNTVKGPKWLPRPMGLLSSQIPSWVTEGLAEYYTEKWRPFRFDISHKGHVLRNTVHKIKDPHNDGFSKSLYLADRFGDSTITRILNHRNKLGFLFFENSFKKHTGINLKQFNEDWRIQMNTYYFGKRSQKESLKDVGIIKKIPAKSIQSFDYFSDTTRMAIIGKISKGQRDLSLILALRDTTKENKIYTSRIKKEKKEGEKVKRPKPKWILKELDHGTFGELIQNLDISPDDKLIVYPKYHYGKKQALMFDIWKYDLSSNKKTLLTNSMRANYPKFSPDGSQILFIAHNNSTTQIFTMKLDGTDIKQITNNKDDVQIITPSWSPDGKQIAFARSGINGWMDIFILELNTGITKQVTKSREGDFNPIWNRDGNKITYTGLYDNTPNLFTYDLQTKVSIQNTDVGDVVIGSQWNDATKTISAITLNTSKDSKIIEVKPDRTAKKNNVIINEQFSSWIKKKPDNPLGSIDPNLAVEITETSDYSFLKNMKHLGTIILPDLNSLLYNSIYTDALGRHTFSSSMWTDYKKYSSIFFQYRNSTGFPFNGFWGFDLYKNANFQVQLYSEKSESFLVEVFNGFSFWGELPYNFGRSIIAKHSLGYSLQVINRSIEEMPNKSLNSIFENPESGDESSLSLNYTFINKRNHTRNLLNPNQGYGLDISIKETLNSFFGDFDYTKAKFDFYINKKLGFFSIYSRHRLEIMKGQPPNQEQLGIVNIPNYYLMGSTTPGREYMSPRGFDGEVRLGDKAYLGTIELRAPVLPIDIFQVFKVINFGKPTIALITDFGDAWNGNTSNQEVVVQSGVETRFSLSLTNVSLLTFSYGWAQSIDKWQKKVSPSSYFQLTLINPF